MAVIIGHIRLINLDAYAKMIDVVAAIIEQDGQILLAQRPPHADQPGMWEFAGGKVEPGETSRRRWPANCRRRWHHRPPGLLYR